MTTGEVAPAAGDEFPDVISLPPQLPVSGDYRERSISARFVPAGPRATRLFHKKRPATGLPLLIVSLQLAISFDMLPSFSLTRQT